MIQLPRLGRTARRAGLALLAAGFLAAPGSASAAIVFDNITGPPNATPGPSALSATGNTRIAWPFTASGTGAANAISIWAQCTLGAGCPGPGATAGGVIEIRNATATGPGATLLASAPITLASTSSEPTCATAPAAQTLTQGQNYFAVLRATTGELNWSFQSSAAGTPWSSNNGGTTWQTINGGGLQKTLSLRVESGGSCGAALVGLPVPGTALADELVSRPGAMSVTSLGIQNSGTANLRLLSGAITGPNANLFALWLLDPVNNPAPLVQPFTFPAIVPAAGTGITINITCQGDNAPAGIRSATLTLTTNDPVNPTVSWPLRCLVDNQPPTVGYLQTPNGLAGWWRTTPAALTIQGLDPETNNFVTELACTENGVPRLFATNSTTRQYTAQGVTDVSCTALDRAGNRSGAFPTQVKIDTQSPSGTVSRTPAANANGWNNSPVTVNFSACSDPAPGSGVVPPFSQPLSQVANGPLFDGSIVRPCTDVAGNTAQVTSPVVRVDTVAPTLTAQRSTPANVRGWNNTSPVTVAFTCADGGSGIAQDTVLDVTVTGETSAAGQDAAAAGLCRDRADNDAAAPAPVNVKIDLTAPVSTGPTVTPAPNAAGWNNDPSVTAVSTCSDALSGVAGVTLLGLTSNGETAGRVQDALPCVDRAGNVGPTAPAWTIRNDLTAPVVSATVTPAANAAGWNNSAPVSVDFVCSDALSGVATDTLVTEQVGAETPAAGTDVPAAGQCLDVADNAAAAFTKNVKVDTTAPDTTITVVPPAASNAADATVEFTGSDALSGPAGAECRVDGAAFAACTSPATFPGLADGAHTVDVRALDVAGNIDPTPASFTWTVDTQAPDTTITSAPARLVASGSADLDAVGDPGAGTPVAKLECALDGAPFTDCPPAVPFTLSGLSDGAHSIEIRAVDAAGNADATPATASWTVDTSAPTVAISAAPPAQTTLTTAEFTFAASDGGSGVARVECRVDQAAFAQCPTSTSFTATGVAVGAHTFDVRAVDQAGNVGSAQRASWTVNALPAPAATGVSPQPAPITRTVTLDPPRCLGITVTVVKGRGPVTIRIFSGKRSIRLFGKTTLRVTKAGKTRVCVDVPRRSRTYAVRVTGAVKVKVVKNGVVITQQR